MNKCIVIFSLLFFPFLSRAQNLSLEMIHDKKKGMLIGWELGINQSYIKLNTDFKLEKIKNYRGGLVLSYPWNEKWKLLNTLCYERKGAYSNGVDVLYRLNYLSLSSTPAFTFKFLHVYAGFHFAYLLKATDDIPPKHIVLGAITEDKFKPLDLGMTLGIGINFLKKFSLDLTYDHGIASVYDKPIYGANGVSIYGHSKLRNRTLILSLKAYIKQVNLKR